MGGKGESEEEGEWEGGSEVGSFMYFLQTTPANASKRDSPFF